jgi:type VII secretion-associated serine protease mycosin
VTGHRRRIAATVVAALTLVVTTARPAGADSVRDAQWHLAFLDVARAHQLSQGEGVVVAAADSGVNAQHPDLVGNVLPGRDFFDPVDPRGWTDIDGHGTAMAGLIAGHGHNGGGELGVAPKAKILPVRIGSDKKNYAYAEGIAWAAANGARVICLAFGSAQSDEPRMAAAVKDALRQDVVVVAAAGNRPDDSTVAYPAAYPGVVAAAGVNRNGGHAEVSVTGPQVVLAAPSDDIVSTHSDGKYLIGTGTSNSTAIIAGAAALVRARYPNLSAAEVVHRLTATAIDKGPPGRDDQYGYGIVNLVGALTADVAPLPPSPSPQPSAQATSAKAAPAAPPAGSGQPPVGLLAAVVAALLAAGAAGIEFYRRRGRAAPADAGVTK